MASFLPADALQHLSSRQALADLAGFHAHVTEAFGLTAQNKWVSWGGSYPGMLAGWFRLRFPHLVHAAVASSAPVQAQLDMRGYNDVRGAGTWRNRNHNADARVCLKQVCS